MKIKCVAEVDYPDGDGVVMATCMQTGIGAYPNTSEQALEKLKVKVTDYAKRRGECSFLFNTTFEFFDVELPDAKGF